MTAVLWDKICLEHNNPPEHPESGARLTAVLESINDPHLSDMLVLEQGRDATFEELARVHTPEYLAGLVASGRSARTAFDPDTVAGPNTWKAAVRAAGMAVTAVDLVLSGAYDKAFSFSRPPGHHAERNRAMGFCFLNNIAIAAGHAIEKYSLSRILILDWDVHHGNGTQNIFYETDQVLFVSLHQFPLYPGTGPASEVGKNLGKGYNLNIPLEAGAGSREYLTAFRQKITPAVRRYKPELVLVSAGFDADYRDPLASMRLSPPGFQALTEILLEYANRYSRNKAVFVLEGGYDGSALQEGTTAVLSAIAGTGQDQGEQEKFVS